MRRTLLNLIERGNRFNINLVFFLTHWQMLQLIVPIGLDIQSISFSLSSIYIPYTNIGIRMKVQNLISLWRTYELFVINHHSRCNYHVAIMTAVMYSDFKSLKICIFNIKQKQMASYAFLISTALLIHWLRRKNQFSYWPLLSYLSLIHLIFLTTLLLTHGSIMLCFEGKICLPRGWVEWFYGLFSV